MLAIVGILLSLLFAFTNGYNDAGADVATMVSSGAASVKGALLTASLANFVGALVGGSAVVLTMQGVLNHDVGENVALAIFAAVVAANAWNIFTWYYGIPSSSTHALIGGLIGVGLAFHGLTGVNWGWEELMAGHLTGVTKVLVFLIASVLLGFLGGYHPHEDRQRGLAPGQDTHKRQPEDGPNGSPPACRPSPMERTTPRSRWPSSSCF